MVVCGALVLSIPADADSMAALCERTQIPPLNQSQIIAMTKPHPYSILLDIGKNAARTELMADNAGMPDVRHLSSDRQVRWIFIFAYSQM